MKAAAVLVALAVPLLLPALAGAQAPSPPPLQIPYTQFTLPNGLHVILHEDHTVPLAYVNVLYDVGSANELPGRTGFAHLFEHLMFMGSGHAKYGVFDQSLEAAGGTNNASTSNDVTNYWIMVPTSALDLALFLESDRMGYLLDSMTPEILEAQREVVKNERRERVENEPYGSAGVTLEEMLYPAGHPYHWPVIGYMTDLDAASYDDVTAFFRKYDAPSNASLVVAGDINTGATRALVEKWFGDVKAGPRPDPLTIPGVALTGVQKKTITDRVELPRLYLAWLTPRHLAPGDAALDIAANLLSGGKDSRLFKRLVYDMQIAQDVSAYQLSRNLSSYFLIEATPRPGHTVAELQKVIDEELAKLAAGTPTPHEVQRAINQYEAAFYDSLERLGGQHGGKADQMNAYYLKTGNPDWFNEDLARYRSLSPSDIRAAVEAFLPLDRRVELTGDAGTNESWGSNAKHEEHEVTQRSTQRPFQLALMVAFASVTLLAQAPDRTKLPVPGRAPALKLPAIEKRQLTNGLPVWIVELHEVPVVQVNLIVRSGSADDPAGRFGVASMTAAMLENGAGSRSALDIADAIDFLGASLETTSGSDATAIRLHTPGPRLSDALPIMADVALRPSFPRDELDRLRQDRLTSILQARNDPPSIASLAFSRVLFGTSHRFGTAIMGTSDTIRSLTIADLRAFYTARYRPDNTTLLVAGDITPGTILPLLEAQFGKWRAQGAAPAHVVQPEPPASGSRTIYLVDKPGAPQSQIRIGRVGVARSTPDFFPIQVMNTVLGGAFSSRLNMNLREDKGFTYGASSTFDMRISPGPFFASAGVQTDKTAESLREFFKELDGIRQPIPSDELARAKNYVALRFPERFETTGDMSTNLENLVVYRLPDDYFSKYVDAVQTVSAADAQRVAQKYIVPDTFAVVVVGDLKSIEPGIRALNLGTVRTLTIDDIFGPAPR